MEARQSFINSSRFGVAIVKCFGVCPRAGKYSASGYRGITLIAEIDGKPLEVQLVTPYMVMWADWAYGVLLDVSICLRCRENMSWLIGLLVKGRFPLHFSKGLIWLFTIYTKIPVFPNGKQMEHTFLVDSTGKLPE